MRILLVDDEEEFVTTLAERLTIRGVEAEFALSGQEALAKAEEKDYDLVVVDIKMPGIGGAEVMRRLEAKKPDQKFIVLTGHLEGFCDPEAAAAGRCFRLIKPTDIDTLMAMIQKIKGT
ncbi:MAG: response regulator [Thermodesulfobacteriota bacterium]